jgi:hypothetical protein
MQRVNLFVAVAVFALITVGIMPGTAIAASESESSIEQTFQKAKQDYLQKNLKSAAQQIQKSAAYMKTKAAQASAEGKEALNASARELEKLADDVKKGAVASVKSMEKAFARAYVALAAESHIKSTQSWAKKEAAKAGDALDSATRYLERSFTWAGQKVETSTKNAMQKSKELALKLKKKGSMMAEEVGKGLKDAGSEIEKLGKKISPK